MASKILFKLQDGDTSAEDRFAIDYVARAYRMDYDTQQQWESQQLRCSGDYTK